MLKQETLLRAALPMLAAGLFASGAQAQDIVSNDGEWRASLDTNGTGQITNLFNSGGTVDNLFETLWYEASTGSGGLTARVETTYTTVGSNVGTNSASFNLTRNDGRMGLDVTITMVDGANGGALYNLLWTNLGSGQEDLKGFAYADLDVDASSTGDFASYVVGDRALLQSDGGVDIYFGGTQDYKSWEIDTFANLRGNLDAGRSQLLNSGGGGPADFTSALSSETFSLAPGASAALTFQIGGLATPAPGAVALLGLAGLAGRRRRRA